MPESSRLTETLDERRALHGDNLIPGHYGGVVHALRWDSRERHPTWRGVLFPPTLCGYKPWNGATLTREPIDCKTCLKVLARRRQAEENEGHGRTTEP